MIVGSPLTAAAPADFRALTDPEVAHVPRAPRPSVSGAGDRADHQRDVRAHRASARPRAAAGGARLHGLGGLGRDVALARPGRAGDHLHALGAWRDGRVSPPVHASQLQDDARGAGRAGGAGFDLGRRAGDRMGGDASQAPQLLRPAGGPAQPARRPGGRVAGGAARARARTRRLDVPRQGHGQPAPLREGSARRPRPARDQPPVPALGGRRPGSSRSGSAWR